jgi:class 3 adenylate cyclase
VLGDMVNVVARIEQATKQFGVPMLASEATLRAAGGDGLSRSIITSARVGAVLPSSWGGLDAEEPDTANACSPRGACFLVDSLPIP